MSNKPKEQNENNHEEDKPNTKRPEHPDVPPGPPNNRPDGPKEPPRPPHHRPVA